jgi:hypothetical protein
MSPQEWKEAALTLDRYLDFHEWKQVEEDPFYDWKLVKKVTRLPGVYGKLRLTPQVG